MYGQRIIEEREKFLHRINEVIQKAHEKLSGGRERLRLVYEKNVDAECFENELKKNREKDLHFRASTSGPHKDDISFYIGELDVRRFGSQGQQRTAALSLKLAEIELVKQEIKDTPILLLDDVLSELDRKRQHYLLDSIGDIQTCLLYTSNWYINITATTAKHPPIFCFLQKILHRCQLPVPVTKYHYNYSHKSP